MNLSTQFCQLFRQLFRWSAAPLCGASLFFTSTTLWGTDQIVVIGGALTQERNLSPYFEGLEDVELTYLYPNVNPFSANHVRDYADFTGELEGLVARTGGQRVHVFAYSVGGKHALRLARDRGDLVQSVYVVDPVDGPPPVGGGGDRFPVFIAKGDVIDLPARLLWTEEGERPGLFGIRCVNPDAGGRYLIDALGLAADQQLLLAKAGHLDILFGRLGLGLRGTCPRGSGDAGQIRQEIKTDWEAFFAEHRFSEEQ